MVGTSPIIEAGSVTMVGNTTCCQLKQLFALNMLRAKFISMDTHSLEQSCRVRMHKKNLLLSEQEHQKLSQEKGVGGDLQNAFISAQSVLAIIIFLWQVVTNTP